MDASLKESKLAILSDPNHMPSMFLRNALERHSPKREREKFFTRQQPIRKKDKKKFLDLRWAPQQQQKEEERRGEGGGENCREKVSVMEVDVRVDSTKSEIKVKRRRGHE